MQHLDDHTTAAFAAGSLSGTARQAAEVHLDTCDECRSLVADVARGTAPPPALAPLDDDVLVRGDTIGRFVVLGMLGDGAGGAVYAAHDPDLDRRIAIKLLHEASSDALHEAQTLAKLSHPNVLTIYDTGTWRERVYLATEHVDGLPLDAWLAGHPPWTEIRQVVIQVARGLAAAHAASIIHRDVKPSNILVGKDRRTRVADFGLAITGTAKGRAGTPAYMAPEQRDHGEASTRSDQYSLGLVVREAIAEMRVPVHISRVIERMLAEEPTDRYPDMDAVVRELERDPARTVRRALLVAGGLGVIALGAGLVGARAAGANSACDDAAGAFATAWSFADRVSIDRAFAATGRSYASRAATEAARLLDDYGRQWRDLRVETCHAAARDELSRELRDRTFACLDQRRASVRGVVDALAGGAVDDALRLVEGLPALAPCTDPDQLRAVPPPHIAALRARIESAVQQLDAGQVDRVEVLLPALVSEARASGDDRTIAEALGVHANLLRERDKLDEAEQLLYEAAHRAGTAGDDELVARSTISLLEVVGNNQARYREGDLLARLGEAVVAKTSDDMLVALLAYAIGDLRTYEAKPEAAAQSFERAITAVEQARGPEALLLITFRARLGAARGVAGNARRGLPELEKAVELARLRLGTDHPDTVNAEIMLGSTLVRAGQPARGQTILEGAVEKYTTIFGPRSLRVASALSTLAWAQQEAGKLSLARTTSERSLAIQREVHGPNHVALSTEHHQLGWILTLLGETSAARAEYRESLRLQLAMPGNDGGIGATYNSLATLAESEGHFDEARAIYDEALATIRRVNGERSRDVAVVLSNRASILLLHGDRRAALADRATAIAILEETVGPDHPDLAAALTSLADETDDPKPALERALAIRLAALGPSHPSVASTQHALARYALKQDDAPGALTYARAAATTLEASLGLEHPNTAIAQITIGEALAATGDAAGGLTTARAALARLAQHHATHPMLAAAYAHTAQIALLAGDNALAREMFEHARERYLALHMSDEKLGDVELELAKLVSDRTAALALGKSALARYGASHMSRIETARAWLACVSAAQTNLARCASSTPPPR
ncbi:MAG: tetratricopeptide repeat protein [Kofleriaceae bacterium]|nr:tetratricopeptide repeat protein [Kofleriaceae bacterium]